MNKMNNIIRKSVYFNLDVPKDKILYDYLVSLNNGKRLSSALKEVALIGINKSEPIAIPNILCEMNDQKLNLSNDDKENLAGMF